MRLRNRTNHPDATKVEDEMNMLKDSMYSFLSIWQHMEDLLAMLLHGLLGPKAYGLAVYFTPASAETRFAIVNAVIIQFYRDTKIEDRAIETWALVLERLHRFRKFRNKVAHGSVSAPTIYGKQYARITGPMFQLSKPTKGRIPVPGIDLNELNKQIKRGFALLSYVHAITNLINLGEVLSETALQEKFGQLRDHLLTHPDEPIILNFPELDNLSQSSEA